MVTVLLRLRALVATAVDDSPFVALLGSIALLPLVPASRHWWDSNLNKFIVAVTLGLVTLAYYAFLPAVRP